MATENEAPAATESKYAKITEEGLAHLRAKLGREYRIEEPYLRYVNWDSILHVCRAIGDVNSLYTEPEYSRQSHFGQHVAPPAWYYGAGWGSWDLRRGVHGLPGVHGLHSGDHWCYYRPLFAGDEVHGIKALSKLEEKQGSYAGRMILQVVDVRFYNQRNELCSLWGYPAFRVERGAGKKNAKYAGIKKAFYTDEELADIEAAYDAEVIRGSEPRYWEDVQIGEPVQPVVKGPLCVADMIAWIAGIGSPHVRSGQYWLAYRRVSPKVAVKDPATGIPEAVERVHWDPFMAAEIGQPAPYDYGSQRAAWSTTLFTNWAGDAGWLAELDVQFRNMLYLGDTIWIKGEVVDKWRGARTGTGYVEIKVNTPNQRGTDIMPGRGVVALPSRERGPVQFPVDVVADGRA